jgi:hypothetical protein
MEPLLGIAEFAGGRGLASILHLKEHRLTTVVAQQVESPAVIDFLNEDTALAQSVDHHVLVVVTSCSSAHGYRLRILDRKNQLADSQPI